MGNDQLWEGKGDKRSYNTDFIGRITVSEMNKLEPITIKQNNIIFTTGEVQATASIFEPQSVDNTLIDFRKGGLLNKDTFYPYVALLDRKIDISKSWLSDHSLVFSTINLQTVSSVLSGGARKSRLLRNIKKTNTNNNRNNRKKNNNKSTKKRKMNNRKKLSRKGNKKMRIKSKKN
jgi:hypothetical protein